jgi:hypothetical protein
MPNGDSASDDFVVSYVNDDTGLPESVPIPRDALRDAIVANPRIFVDSLRDLLEGARPGVVPGGGRRPPIAVRPQVPILPADTPIDRMLPPESFARLSPAVQRLTKQDLVALGGWGPRRATPAELGLSARDISDIRGVFSDRINPARVGGELELSISCCCCTPCCCATAELEPARARN